MRITRANRQAVKYACLNFHYAKITPTYSYAYNIYNDNSEWCGCILFGLGATVSMAKSLNCISGACLELQRVALNGKQGHNATSQALSMAMKEVKKDATYLQCLFSFADSKQSHIGIIYQATNWIFTGESKSYEYGKDNVIYHQKTVSDRTKRTGKTAAELGFIRKRTMVKYRYIYPFDKQVKKLILSRKLPYPK